MADRRGWARARTRTLRLGLWVLTCLGSLGWAVTYARTSAQERLLEWSRETFQIDPRWLRGEPRALLLNGARLRIESGTHAGALSELLDRAQLGCRTQAGLAQHVRDLAKHDPGALRALGDGVLRLDGPKSGVVACFGPAAGVRSMAELVQQLRGFAAQLDLAELGGIRALFARTTDAGIFFVTVANEGRVPLARMFPARGDAPGVDPEGLPRPASSTRLLSLWADRDDSSRLTAYAVQRDPTSAFRDFDRELRARGFRTTENVKLGGPAYYARDGQQVIVHAQASESGCTLSLLEL